MLKCTQNSSMHEVTELFFPVDITFYLTVSFLPPLNCSVYWREVQAARTQDRTSHGSRHCRVAARHTLPSDPRTSPQVPLRKSTCWPHTPRTLMSLWDDRAWQWVLPLSLPMPSHSWSLWPPCWFCVLTRHPCRICWHWSFSLLNCSSWYSPAFWWVLSCSVRLVSCLLKVVPGYRGEYHSGFLLTLSLDTNERPKSADSVILACELSTLKHKPRDDFMTPRVTSVP